MEKWALVTGATAGIGRAIAEKLAQDHWNLVLTGRRDQRLKDIQAQLEQEHSIQVVPLSFDISDRESCEKVVKENQDTLAHVSVLINNAGLAKGVDPMDVANLDDWDAMVDTNIKGLLYITRLMLPHIKAHPSGHIINIGSVAGRWTYPGGGVYCATKFAVRALSEGLRMDLNGKNVRVTNIAPGLVQTEFSEVRLQDTKKAQAVYQGLDCLQPEDIADCVHWAMARPQHVNIQEMVVFPTVQASVTQVHRD